MSRSRKKTPPQPSSKADRLTEPELDLVRERDENQRLWASNMRLQQLLENGFLEHLFWFVIYLINSPALLNTLDWKID